MAALLSRAEAVFASWGTTALLEAAIFKRPIVQLRWMDALPGRAPEDRERIRDVQRYEHMKPFDAIGCRIFSFRRRTSRRASRRCSRTASTTPSAARGRPRSWPRCPWVKRPGARCAFSVRPRRG